MKKQMTLQFENDLEYQNEAISSICDIFEGEETFQNFFSMTDNRGRIDNIGIGNALSLSQEAILANMQTIQLKNGLPQATEETFEQNKMNFSVEMETGTGKTYVYLKTIFEMNKRYGFTKFIIVVPSIAIKEGTNKTLDITRDHFRGDVYHLLHNRQHRLQDGTRGAMALLGGNVAQFVCAAADRYIPYVQGSNGLCIVQSRGVDENAGADSKETETER